MTLTRFVAHESARSQGFAHAVQVAFIWLCAGACGSVPNDPGARIFPPQGVIRGTVVYQGPRPCSRNGHIVGNAVVLVFDRRDLPPPDGLSNTAVNFADVIGDVLFENEPRHKGPDVYCPSSAGFHETITASAPFEVAPLGGGSYEIRGFFDYTGNFLPEFSIRNLPERGDIGGGYIDAPDALRPINVGNPNYKPLYLPVTVGVRQLSAYAADPSAIPEYAIPHTGFVADNVTVTMGLPLPMTRPYFYAQGQRAVFHPDMATSFAPSVVQSSDRPATDSNGIEGATESDPNSMPVLTIPQDFAVLAPPMSVSPANVSYFESTFPHLRLQWGVPGSELQTATAAPFQMQVELAAPAIGQGFFVWQNARLDPATQRYVPQDIPEGNGIPQLWPQVLLTKLPDSKSNGLDPIVVLQGITLLPGAEESFLRTGLAALNGALMDPSSPGGPRPVLFAQDHLSVVLRPSAICFPSRFERGTLVTPHPTATTADLDCSSNRCIPSGVADRPIVSPELVAQLASVVSASVTGCLPIGRYAINVVYPDGQAWTVPNEAGVCSRGEGSPDDHVTCSIKHRPVLYSQGARAVVEVVAAQDPAYCQANPVPAACLASR